MARPNWATPAAIVAGSVIMAGGMYFGLRARPIVVAAPSSVGGAAAGAGTPADLPTTPTSVSSPPAQGAAVPPAAMVQAQITGASPAGPPEVNHDVLAALEKQRSLLVSSCWTPAITGPSKPASATYDFDLAFNEAGHEIARGISGREGSSTALTQCLYKNSPPLDIPTRGARLHSRVRFTLP